MHNPMNKHQSDKSAAGGFLAGLVVGGLAGAGTALLLAPESGERTRADIQQKGIELRDQTMETAESTMADVRAKAKSIANQGSKKAKALELHGQEMVEEQRNRFADAVEQIQP